MQGLGGNILTSIIIRTIPKPQTLRLEDSSYGRVLLLCSRCDRI